MAQPNKKNSKPLVTIPNANDSESIISMVLGAMIVVVVGALLFSYIRDWRQKDNATAQPEPTASTDAAPIVVEELPQEVVTVADEQGREVPVNLPAQYTVKSGESTWMIAQAFYGSGFNYIDIEAANNIPRDAELQVGQVLNIPKVAVRSAQEAGQPSEYASQPGQATDETGPAKGDDSQAQEELAE